MPGRRPACLILLLALAGAPGCRNDEAPTRKAGKVGRAGKEGKGPWVLARIADDSDFSPLPPARPGDWRRGPGSDEEPQSLNAYVSSNPVRATKRRRRIVLQPIGPFDGRGRELLAAVRRWAGAFFATTVDVASPVPLPASGKRTRGSGAGAWTQYETGELLRNVLRPRLPSDAICYLGVTMADLYPRDSWNFVFGVAYLSLRTGVYSFARYFPSFHGEKETPGTRLLVVKRACNVLAHETGHMFGMHHCLHYSCVMNGSNSLHESDRQPSWLCPVCLSKLTWNRGFDPVRRYRELAALSKEFGWKAEARWFERRAKKLQPR